MYAIKIDTQLYIVYNFYNIKGRKSGYFSEELGTSNINRALLFRSESAAKTFAEKYCCGVEVIKLKLKEVKQ